MARSTSLVPEPVGEVVAPRLHDLAGAAPAGPSGRTLPPPCSSRHERARPRRPPAEPRSPSTSRGTTTSCRGGRKGCHGAAAGATALRPPAAVLAIPGRPGRRRSQSPSPGRAPLRVPEDNGTRCSRPDLVRSSGIVHILLFRSNSGHCALRTSPLRQAVRTSISRASLVVGLAPDE